MSPAVADASPVSGLTPIQVCCEHCSSHDLDKREYKRCGGCETVLYCSKECQRAAWPSHKEVCRSERHTSVSELGYASPLALKKVLQEWVETHSYSLTTLANIVVYLNGGWSTIHSQPYAIVTYLVAAPYSKEANPSQGCRVMRTTIAHRESDNILRQGWEKATRACLDVEQDVRQEHADTFASNLLGVVPAMLLVEGTGIPMLHKWMIFRHDVSHVPDSPTNETTRQAFKDLALLCTGVIHGGYVFRASQDRAQREPEIGRLVKMRNQKWNWEKMNIDINVVITGNVSQETTHSGLSNRELLTLIRPL